MGKSHGAGTDCTGSALIAFDFASGALEHDCTAAAHRSRVPRMRRMVHRCAAYGAQIHKNVLFCQPY
eukprot:1917075-Rhodomonas_salina.1